MSLLTTTKKLKIWTIITHALIIVGAGHGILFFFMIEIVSFPYIQKIISVVHSAQVIIIIQPLVY